MEALLGYTLDQMFAEPARSSPEAGRWGERIAARDPERLFRAGLAVFDRASIVDRIDRIDAPALVMVGEEDAAIPPTHGRRLAECLPDAELVEVEGAGHMLPIEAPERVAEEVAGFLGGRAAGNTEMPEG